MILKSEFWSRFSLMFAGIAILTTALWAGLVRIGWNFSPLVGGLPAVHGPLIVCGFLGTYFSLERSVTLKSPWAFSAPLLIAVGCLALIAAPEGGFGGFFVLAGSAVFLLVCGLLFKRQPTYFSAFIFLGSFQWLMANVFWILRWPVYAVVLWWMSFVLFTTAGERLEMLRLSHLAVRDWLEICLGVFLVFLGHFLVAINYLRLPENLDIQMDAIIDPRVGMGMIVAGAGLMIAAYWLIRHDIARRSLKNSGMSGYIAFCMLSAYFWLAVNGILCVRYAGLVSGFVYDAFIHTFFVGFVFFMIFGHGPVIAPAVLDLFIAGKKIFYAPAYLLHASLILRLTGDELRSLEMRKWGSLVNFAAILIFVGILGIEILAENWSRIKGEKKQEQKAA